MLTNAPSPVGAFLGPLHFVHAYLAGIWFLPRIGGRQKIPPLALSREGAGRRAPTFRAKIHGRCGSSSLAAGQAPSTASIVSDDQSPWGTLCPHGSSLFLRDG